MSESSRLPILDALEPSRSVVVEACAGSGKTWLLASRIVRLLLSGIAPGEILAITFTRKAAREIEERVVDWLHLLATGSDAQVAAFLEERGVPVAEDVLRKARGLYERVLAAQPRLAVNTFHGWFLQLVDAAPLSANLCGATLVETDSRLFDELWQSFAAGLQKAPESALTQGFVRLLAEAGLDSTRRLIRRALDRRSEWLAYGEGAPDVAGKAVAALRELLGVEEDSNALEAFFAGAWATDLQIYLGFLEMSELASDQAHAASIAAALDEPDAATRFEMLRGVLLTGTNTLRQRKSGKAAEKRFGVEGVAHFIDLHARLGERVLACIEQQIAERIVALNADACVVFAAFLAHVDEYKKARRQIDFVDAEWTVLQLLRDEATAAFLQARLDARYSHVLLDEFQDTNPLQWQILLAWLDAYSDAARPGIFLVGDPKQSIYRFRRAEPRLFSVAADYLVREYGALRREQDVTRRNARPIVDLVNALFLGVPEFMPFREQASFAGALPGRVELLPLCGKATEEESQSREGLRDPLIEPEVEAEDLRLAQEAECLAMRIAGMVGVWQIEDKANSGSSGQPPQRPVRYGDIMLLVRTRTHLACYERALVAANIPFDAGSRGGLLAALEVRDIVALFEFLVTPVDDLKLAHALRSPVFACSNEELLLLAERSEACWWQRLLGLTKEDAATPRLLRAVRLLGEWLQTADRLPAHDLLDRIYHQGEVIERYRLAAPVASAASVEANRRALLLLALDLDGGRYPSLPRFIDELRDLRDADSNDAPDEGAIEAQSQDAGRVRILTIHGAKGLEAPIVWLLGANAPVRPPAAWDVLVDWSPEAPSPQHFSFFGRKEDQGVARGPMFEAERVAARREELNLLYVAVTRARQVFIASGIENARDKGESPYRLLEAALEKLGGALVYGDDLPQREGTGETNESSQAASTQVPLPAVGERRRTPDAAERFGILLHALLERRTEGDASEGWWAALGFSDADYRRVVPVAERILSAPALQRFFDPAQYLRAWNEVDLAGPDGKLLRIDRLVELDSGYWVLDYKSSGSGTERIDDYRMQVSTYCQAVSAIFPQRPVRGALIFADASVVEVA